MFCKTYTCPYNSALSLITISGFALKKVKGFAAAMTTMTGSFLTKQLRRDSKQLLLDENQGCSRIHLKTSTRNLIYHIDQEPRDHNGVNPPLGAAHLLTLDPMDPWQ